jgi:leader peptidase (prepilin peptidase)/N-methyltransferase
MAFSPRYVLVEILTALLFVICFVVLGISVLLIKALVLTAFLLVIAFMDIDHQLIFDKVLLWLAGSGVVINWATGATGTVDMLCGGLGGGILLLILAMARKDGLGGGDIKFTAVLGVWLGWKLTLLTLLLSFLFGGTTGMVLLLLKLKSRQDLIPFGPFLALGAWISLLFGDVLLCYSL